jgi:3-methylcrotonyl-CoA carboxylase alpha subunit
MSTGLDLVEWQLRVAAGEPLPLRQEEVTIRGHAIEARIYAEDADRGFVPSTGRLAHVALPEATAHVRVDAGVGTGNEITPFYDAMIAKLIVRDETRELALARMSSALEQCHIVGVTTNVAFLQRLIACRAFSTADLDTSLIERENAHLFPPPAAPPRAAWLAAAVAILARDAQLSRNGAASPWSQRDGWRNGTLAARTLQLRAGEFTQVIRVNWRADGWNLDLDGVATQARGIFLDATLLDLELGPERQRVAVLATGATLRLFLAGAAWTVTHIDPFLATDAAAHADHELRAPMPGRVISLLAPAGTTVSRGAPLLVLEAMKMEHTVVAPCAGLVEAFNVAVGEQVAEGVELVRFVPSVP